MVVGDFEISFLSVKLWLRRLFGVLMKEGIWQKVIKDKYLPFTTVKNWLRSATFHQPSTSKIWNSLLKSVHLITNWLSWNPGSGHHVVLGRDRILGMGDLSFLSQSLIDTLRQKQITVLAQAWRQHEHDSFLTSWVSSLDLDITGDLAVEWE
jgi:hypothetical protein